MAGILALTAVLLTTGCGAPVNSGAARPGTSPAATSRASPAPVLRTSTNAVFALLAANPPAQGLPAIKCTGEIGASDTVAVVYIQDGRPVLRDYADPAHPATVCELGPEGVRQLVDARHVVVGGGDGYAVVDLPEVRFHWFNLPFVGAGTPSELLAVSPALDAVSWYVFDPSANADQVHLTTAAGDRVVASLPSRGAGRCGSPEDSSQGGYSRSGGHQFALLQDDPGEQALLVLEGDQTRLKLVPPAGLTWAANKRPGMAVWSPSSEALYYRQAGDVWRWTPAGTSRFLPHLNWYYPTIAPDGHHLAFSVLRPDGLHDVYLVDLVAGTPPRKIGGGARNQPAFLTASLLWFKSDGPGMCGPGGDKPLIYDLADGSESPSALLLVGQTWPATGSNH